MNPTRETATMPHADATYCAGAVAHIDVGGLRESHVEELRRHAAKLLWQMENDERPAPSHGWTCFHCAQTFLTWASASAHFGEDPRDGRPACFGLPPVGDVIRSWAEGPRDDVEGLVRDVLSCIHAHATDHRGHSGGNGDDPKTPTGPDEGSFPDAGHAARGFRS